MKAAVQLFQPPQNFNYHAWRQAGLGGSDAPIIMNASPWMTRLQLWEIKTGRRPPQEVTYPMRMGIKNEPIARQWFEQKTRREYPKALAIHPVYDFIRLSLDGFNPDLLAPLEIKCPGAEDHFLAASGVIPEKYQWQCEHYLLVLALRAMSYLSYNERYADEVGDIGVHLPFRGNKERQEMLLEALHEFWNCVVEDVPPPAEPPCFRSKTMKPKLTVVKPQVFKTRTSRPKPAPKRAVIPRVHGATESSQYTAHEVLDILERAKALGVAELKVAGLEVRYHE